MTKGRLPYWATGPFFCLVLMGCGSSTQPTSEESHQLDNAEELLNAADDELSGIDTNAVADPEDAPPE